MIKIWWNFEINGCQNIGEILETSNLDKYFKE